MSEPSYSRPSSIITSSPSKDCARGDRIVSGQTVSGRFQRLPASTSREGVRTAVKMTSTNKQGVWGGLAVALMALCVPAFGAEENSVSYYDDVRPVIQRACQGCHQPATKMGGLVLTSYPEIVRGGQRGPIFKEGSPAKSSLIGHLTGEKEPRMPMGQDHLPAEEIELFRRWVQQGAKDDTPESAKGPKIPDQPPVYQQPPVISGLAYSPAGP